MIPSRDLSGARDESAERMNLPNRSPKEISSVTEDESAERMNPRNSEEELGVLTKPTHLSRGFIPFGDSSSVIEENPSGILLRPRLQVGVLEIKVSEETISVIVIESL